MEIFRATKAGDLAAVQRILSENPEAVGAHDRDASTPLHWAARKGYAAIVEALLDAGADIQAENQNDHWGTTPLHAAAHGNQKAAADVLLRRGADVNALDREGHTPLDETKVHRATAVAKLLEAATRP